MSALLTTHQVIVKGKWTNMYRKDFINYKDKIDSIYEFTALFNLHLSTLNNLNFTILLLNVMEIRSV